MRVKIGSKIYDTNNEPIMVILTDMDKYNICHMHPDAYKYCGYPEGRDTKEIEKFMEIKSGKEKKN